MYVVNIKDLLDQGHLCPLKYIKQDLIPSEQIPLNKSKSDFDLAAYENILGDRFLRIRDAAEYGKRVAKAVLVFCASVEQANTLSTLVSNSAYIHAKTPAKEREAIIDGFKKGKIKAVFNVGVLTEGFDFPALDCVILARPTHSLQLYSQMVGRGVRNAPGKTHCLVIDLSGTVNRLGRIETLRIEKVDGKWELLTEKGSWHAKELYSFDIET